MATELTFPYYQNYNGAAGSGISPAAFSIENVALGVQKNPAAICGACNSLGTFPNIGLLGVVQAILETGSPASFSMPQGTATTYACAIAGLAFHSQDLPGGIGVYGNSQDFDAVVGETQSNAHAGITGRNLSTAPGPGAVGVYGVGGTYAGKFDGNVLVNGTVSVSGDVVLTGNDCAEHFDIDNPTSVEAGTVMVLSHNGELTASREPYDRNVVGVISGAGEYRPAIILGGQPSKGRLPIALVGKAFCKVDADWGSIRPGDMLTTSPTRGHAMKAQDPQKAFGSAIGKALSSLQTGRGLIPILVMLR